MEDFTTKQINKRLNRVETDIEVLQTAVRELRLATGAAGAVPTGSAPTTPLPQEMTSFARGHAPEASLFPVENVPPPPPPPLMPRVVGPTFTKSTPAPEKASEAEPESEKPIQLPAFRPNFDFLRSTEFWLNKVGIALLLLGLAFLFKYSIDQGWINKQVRVAFGLGLGSVLLALGTAFHAERRHFSQVLLGGSVASFYITGFAAYQMYSLVSYEVAFGYMAGVTLLAFVMSVLQDEVMLALIGTLGGLGTPFILNNGQHNLPGLVTYACLVLAGASAIYFYKGWRSLLWIAYTGGWAVFSVGYADAFWAQSPTTADRWAVQGAALFSALAFWALPVLRQALQAEDPARWPQPDLGRLGDLKELGETHVHLLVVSVPLLALAASAAAWGDIVPHQSWGWLAAGAAVLYLRVFLATRPTLPALAYTHAMMAVLLLTLGVFEVLVTNQNAPWNDNTLLLALAIEATALHFVSARLKDRGTSAYGHLIFAVVGWWLLQRVASPLDSNLMSALLGTPLAQIDLQGALANLVLIALGIAASFAVLQKQAVIAYRNAAYLAFAIWLWRDLLILDSSQGSSADNIAYVMLAWAAFAALLNVLYRRVSGRFSTGDTVIPALIIFGGVAALFAWRFVAGHAGDLAILNTRTLIDATVVALAAGCAYELRPQQTSYVYRMAAHLGVLALLWRELGWLPNGDSYVLVAWAAYAALWRYIAVRSKDPVTALAAHAPFVVIATAFLARIATGQVGQMAIFNVKALADLTLILLALFVSTLVEQRWVMLAYRLAAHVAFMALLWRELSALPSDGNAYVTVAWGLYALALTLAGAYRAVYVGQGRTLLYVGVGSLFAVVGKLLLLDLVMLDEIWRILLFLGFGALFLALSYYFQNLLRPARAD